MIFGSFIHGYNNIFRTTVSEFVNDTNTHPIIKYKALFIGPDIRGPDVRPKICP